MDFNPNILAFHRLGWLQTHLSHSRTRLAASHFAISPAVALAALLVLAAAAQVLKTCYHLHCVPLRTTHSHTHLMCSCSPVCHHDLFHQSSGPIFSSLTPTPVPKYAWSGFFFCPFYATICRGRQEVSLFCHSCGCPKMVKEWIAWELIKALNKTRQTHEPECNRYERMSTTPCKTPKCSSARATVLMCQIPVD